MGTMQCRCAGQSHSSSWHRHTAHVVDKFNGPSLKAFQVKPQTSPKIENWKLRDSRFEWCCSRFRKVVNIIHLSRCTRWVIWCGAHKLGEEVWVFNASCRYATVSPPYLYRGGLLDGNVPYDSGQQQKSIMGSREQILLNYHVFGTQDIHLTVLYVIESILCEHSIPASTGHKHMNGTVIPLSGLELSSLRKKIQSKPTFALWQEALLLRSFLELHPPSNTGGLHVNNQQINDVNAPHFVTFHVRFTPLAHWCVHRSKMSTLCAFLLFSWPFLHFDCKENHKTPAATAT